MQRMTISILLLVLPTLFACTREDETPRQESATQTTIVQGTPEQELQMLRSDIQSLKVELTQNGKYSCCIQDACNYCLLHEGECPCLDELESGRHVCVECYAGWQQGKGVAEGINKEEVSTSFAKHEHKQ